MSIAQKALLDTDTLSYLIRRHPVVWQTPAFI